MSELKKQVQVLVEGLVEAGSEDGIQVAVYRHGERVVNATAGLADVGTRSPVADDTLFWSASTAKAVASTVAHVLVDRGVFGYDMKIADVWPEFGAHGKESATLRHLLTHSVGVPAAPADATLERLCDWDWMCARIADTEPWWAPGERVGYHALTYGYIMGELVRRTTGNPISQVLAEEIARPLGIERELYFGVPEAELPRVAHLEDDPAGTAVFASLPADWPLFKSAPRELFPNAAYANRRDILMADIPYSGTGTANGFARMYAALIGEVDGVRLVSPERLKEISTLATTGTDEMTGGPSTYALGYVVGLPWTGAPQDNPTTFGMVGIGVGGAYANSSTGVSVAVLKNRFNPVDATALEKVQELV